MQPARAPHADRSAADEKRRTQLKLAMFLIALAATGAALWTVFGRYGGREERSELVGYFRRTFPALHAQVKSVQAGLAGLVDDTAPSAAGAVSTIDENILPTIDNVLEQARPIAPEGIDARALHAAYLQAIQAMRADAVRARAVFADPTLDLAEKRRRVHAILEETRARFDAFYARAAEVCKEHGIDLKP
jgi:hypothetical protein